MMINIIVPCLKFFWGKYATCWFIFFCCALIIQRPSLSETMFRISSAVTDSTCWYAVQSSFQCCSDLFSFLSASIPWSVLDPYLHQRTLYFHHRFYLNKLTTTKPPSQEGGFLILNLLFMAKVDKWFEQKESIHAHARGHRPKSRCVQGQSQSHREVQIHTYASRGTIDNLRP